MSKAQWSVVELQEIVASHQAQKVGGVLVDVQTANLVANCFRGLDEQSQAKWLELPIQQIASKLWSIVNLKG
jgi:hypothetical protein